MIDNYNDLSIGKYQDIMVLLDGKELDELQMQTSLISMLSDEDEDDILNLPLSEYNKRVQGTAFLLEAPKKKAMATQYKVSDMVLEVCVDLKSIFKQLSQSWKNLTNAQVLAWNALAQTQAGKSVLGTSAKISGANLYSRLNYWIVFCGGEALSNPPALQGVEAPTEAVVTLTPTKFTFELESEPENVQDLKLIIQASAPQSNGVTRAYSKAVQIGGVLEAVTEEYDIKEDYDNKHGAPNAAAPKIFMKYFFVNTKTGEKSGEMLTMVRLDEDAPADGE